MTTALENSLVQHPKLLGALTALVLLLSGVGSAFAATAGTVAGP